MLTSPAADDYNPWHAFRPINQCGTNNARHREYRHDEAGSIQTENEQTRHMRHKNGNVNANTCRRQIGFLAQNSDQKVPGFNEELQVNQSEYVEICRESGNLTYNKTNESKLNVDANVFQPGWKSQNIQGTRTSFSFQRHNGSSNTMTMSDTCLGLKSGENHDNIYSAFRRVSSSSSARNVTDVFSKESRFEVNRNANFIDNDTQNQGNYTYIECYDGELLEVRQSQGEDKNALESFSVYREQTDREDEYHDMEKSTASKDSLTSVSSEEIDDYEVIEWSQHDTHDDVYNQDLPIPKVYLTPTTSPIQDLSGLDGFRTAPSTPEIDEDGPNVAEGDIQIFNIEDRMEESFVITDDNNVQSEIIKENPRFVNAQTGHSQEKLEILENVTTVDASGTNASKDAKSDHHCCKCGKIIKASPNAPVDNANVQNKNAAHETNKSDQATGQKVAEQKKAIHKREQQPLVQFQTPPFITVDSLYYEADPETGSAKIIGRGSFGQVYKARFSDPNFYHLPIVVKEFNEEFSNSRDIIEEAQRLFYLQETGYVPVCYGLLCFSDANRPKYGIVQELVGTGLTMEQMLWDQYQFPIHVWLSISFQCCDGLFRFHEKGILLNDIKTNNIIIDFRHNTVKLKFIDFGLATDMRGKRYKNTKSLESYVYLAPEVRKFGNWTNIASDIYSLGYILRQLYNNTGLDVLEVVSKLCMDRDPEMRLPIQGASSLIHDSIIKHGLDPGTLCLDLR